MFQIFQQMYSRIIGQVLGFEVPCASTPAGHLFLPHFHAHFFPFHLYPILSCHLHSPFHLFQCSLVPLLFPFFISFTPLYCPYFLHDLTLQSPYFVIFHYSCFIFIPPSSTSIGCSLIFIIPTNHHGGLFNLLAPANDPLLSEFVCATNWAPSWL